MFIVQILRIKEKALCKQRRQKATLFAEGFRISVSP
jgi:hypothetical protein